MKKSISSLRGQPLRRGFRLRCEQLEDRWVPDGASDFTTEFSAGITPDSAPAGIVEGPDGNLWFAEFAASRLGRITPAGVVTEFALPAGRGPLNLAVGSDNKLWFTENSGDRIGRIDPLAADVLASLVEFAVPGAGSAPNDIAAGPDGALWFTQSGSDQIGRVTTAGTMTEFDVPGVGSTPAGIANGPDGAVWFTQGGSGQIGRITTAGVVTEFTVPVNGAGFSDPEDITAGPGGHLYFTDFGRSQIGRLTTDGQFTQFSLPINRGPHGIVAGQDGALYFTEAASSRIGRLPASALLPGKATSGQPPLIEYDAMLASAIALGITSTKSGDLWFTQNAASKVSRMKLPLVQITAAATGPVVEVYDIKLNTLRTFTPFPDFKGDLSVAVADFNGNGTPDVIVGAGKGGGPIVKVYDGFDNELFATFFAFDPSFRGGVSLAGDHLTTDGNAEIVVAAGPGGGPHVKVIDGTKLAQLQANGVIADSAVLASFFAFDPASRGGLSLGAGDVTGDNRAEIVLGAGPGADALVKVVDATKLAQVQSNGVIADAALVANFLAFAPGFTGGVFVAAGYENGDNVRDVIVGAGNGGGPHVKVVNGTKLAQATGGTLVPDAALAANFFAFSPAFRGGVRVSADDLTADGQTEIILSAGPGGGPHVKVIDANKLGQLGADAQIADAALISSFFTTDGAERRGVFIASDADHRDGPINGPPGITITNSRRDINDIFVFQSPANPANTVFNMTVSPFSTATTPNTFDPTLLYDFRVANRDLLNTTDDIVFRVTFGPPDAAAGNQQDTVVRALPAARFAGTGGVLVKGFTNKNVPVRGVGGAGTAQFRAAEQDDPFLFDAAGFNALLNNPDAVQGVVDGEYPRGTGTFGPGGTPAFDAPNFFGPNVNTLALTLEVPSDRITAAGSTGIGFWGRIEFNGVQTDRMGRPAINTALIPPIPRGAAVPAGSGGTDMRNAFNAAHPRDDRATFTAPMVDTLTRFYPAGRPGGVPNADQAAVVAGLLLPDILPFDTSSNAGFAGGFVVNNGTTFLGNGRKLSDDIISTELSVLTDDDLPAALGGGPNPPALVTQNVRDDNGTNLTDGSIDPPAPRGGGAAGTGTQRAAVFPYIGAPNPNPTAVPGTRPPD
jgi:streptogramin lyase